MKKIILFLITLSTLLFSREAIIKEILSENMILIDQNGVTKRAQLAGIALFANTNSENKKISYKDREKLHKEAMNYLLENLPIGAKIKFIKIDNENSGPEYIWPVIGGEELNYLMVKHGYALLDRDNPYLLGMFYMRLNRAMGYAKEKRLGLWKDNFEIMNSLAKNQNRHKNKRDELLNLLQKQIK